MNTEDPKIEKLTRELMQGATVQPSSSLMSRIMSAVLKEKKAGQRASVKKLPSLAGLAGGLLVYLAIVCGSLYLFINNPGEAKLIGQEFQQAFPIFLTVAAGCSFFFLFSQLDKWLFKKEKEKASNLDHSQNCKSKNI